MNLVRETNLSNVAVLFVERFSLDSRKINFPIKIATFPIVCLKVSQVDFPNKCVLQSLYIAFIIANSADPDERQQTTKLPFQSFQYSNDLLPILRQVQSSMPLGLKPLDLEH